MTTVFTYGSYSGAYTAAARVLIPLPYSRDASNQPKDKAMRLRTVIILAFFFTVAQAGLDIPPAFKEPPSDEVDAVNP